MLCMVPALPDRLAWDVQASSIGVTQEGVTNGELAVADSKAEFGIQFICVVFRNRLGGRHPHVRLRNAKRHTDRDRLRPEQ